MRHEVFSVKNLTVKNSYITSLDSFTMHIYQGEILGILCSDINEKTALLNLFEGQYALSGNVVHFAGQSGKKQVSERIFRQFFSVAGDEKKVLPAFSVTDNIMLNPDQTHFRMNTGKTRAQVESLLEEFSLSLPLDIPSASLTTAQKYQVEILRAFVQKRKIVVLTNLHGRVTPKEMNQIFLLMHRMIGKGLTFLFMIDTPDTELLGQMDELLIIRHGRDIAQFRSDLLHYNELQNYMLTGSIEAPAIHIDSIDANRYSPGKSSYSSVSDSFDDSEYTEYDYTGYVDSDSDSGMEEILYSFEDVQTDRLHGIDFCLMPGELMKVICADQDSIDAFSDLMHGTTPVQNGKIRISDRTCYFHTLFTAIKNGLYWCPEAPYKYLLSENLSVIDNLLLGPMTKAGKYRISTGIRRNLTDYCRKHFPETYPDCPVFELNDIMRQKLAYRKILLHAPKLLFIEKPFEETILGMNQVTLQMISELQRRGTAIVILSMSMKDAELLDGDILYLKDGSEISEVEMYGLMY